MKKKKTQLEHSSLENFSEGSRGKAGTWALSGCVGDMDGNGEQGNPPQLTERRGCSFSAGRSWAWLTLERLQPPKSLCVPRSSQGSALTHSTHLRLPSRVQSQGGFPGDGKSGQGSGSPIPASTPDHPGRAALPEGNPALGHSRETSTRIPRFMDMSLFQGSVSPLKLPCAAEFVQ